MLHTFQRRFCLYIVLVSVYSLQTETPHDSTCPCNMSPLFPVGHLKRGFWQHATNIDSLAMPGTCCTVLVYVDTWVCCVLLLLCWTVPVCAVCFLLLGFSWQPLLLTARRLNRKLHKGCVSLQQTANGCGLLWSLVTGSG